MREVSLILMGLFLFFSMDLDSSESKEIKFKWFGQACFLIETTKGTQIITDPVEMGSYRIPPEFRPDIVTVSHEHFDHNQTDTVSGTPQILRGLEQNKNAFAEIERSIKDVKIFTVGSYHDEAQGKERGLNAIFIFEFDGIRVVHLGDLGHTLTEGQVQKIGEVDVLLIPVGGKYTISGQEARAVVSQLSPKRAIIPMHYKTEVADFLPFSAEDFVNDKDNVQRIKGSIYQINPEDVPSKPVYVILDFR